MERSPRSASRGRSRWATEISVKRSTLLRDASDGCRRSRTVGANKPGRQRASWMPAVACTMEGCRRQERAVEPRAPHRPRSLHSKLLVSYRCEAAGDMRCSPRFGMEPDRSSGWAWSGLKWSQRDATSTRVELECWIGVWFGLSPLWTWGVRLEFFSKKIFGCS